MPKMPERKDVASTAKASPTRTLGVMGENLPAGRA
jgi:hypothetical protein